MALPGYNVEVLAASSGTTMTTEATSTSDNTTYQITDSSKRLIDLNTDLIVYDSAVVTTERYTVDELSGSITFEDSDAGRVITITGAYLTPATVATADSFSLSITADALENTPFNTRFKTYQQGLISGNINLGRFHVADSLFINDILDNEYKLIKVNVNDSYSIYAYGLLTSDDTDADVADLIKESMTYQITNQIGV